VAGWAAPGALRARWADDPLVDAWVGRLPGLAAGLAERWALRPDGEVWSGFHSAVWPVRDGDDRALVLKVTQPGVDTGPEVAALEHWAASGVCVQVHASEHRSNALLLERLDPVSSLETMPDVDRACDVIAALLAALADGPAPVGFDTTAAEAAQLDDNLARAPGTLLPARSVAQARSTLASLRADPADRLLHFDAHFLNVLPLLGELTTIRRAGD